MQTGRYPKTASADDRVTSVRSSGARNRRSQSSNSDVPYFLSHRNPAKLSRSEYRVCLLLSRGLSLKAVRQELGISNSTLRTHLRNIYAKSGVSSLAELTYHLLTVEGRPFSGSSGDAKRAI